MITNITPVGPYISINKYTEQHGENVSIGLSGEAETVLRWARTKMAEEIELEQLARKNAAVADALAAVKTAESQLKIVVELVK